MPATFVAASTQFSGGTSGTITLPAGIADNDVILMHVTTPGDNLFTPHADWIQIGVSQSGPAGDNARHTVFRHTYNSATPPNLAFNVVGINHHVGFTTGWRGINLSNILDVAVASASASASTTSHSHTGPTTVTNGAMVVISGGHAVDTPVTITSPGNLSSLTIAANYGTTFGNDGSAFGAYGLLNTAGAIGSLSWTSTLSSPRASTIVVLRPVVASLSNWSVLDGLGGSTPLTFEVIS